MHRRNFYSLDENFVLICTGNAMTNWIRHKLGGERSSDCIRGVKAWTPEGERAIGGPKQTWMRTVKLRRDTAGWMELLEKFENGSQRPGGLEAGYYGFLRLAARRGMVLIITSCDKIHWGLS